MALQGHTGLTPPAEQMLAAAAVGEIERLEHLPMSADPCEAEFASLKALTPKTAVIQEYLLKAIDPLQITGINEMFIAMRD